MLSEDIKISRPGLWFPTVWIYLVPFTLEDRFWEQVPFWIGFLFVTFPLNYLVYGLNDCNDILADKINHRKGNFIFGAQASKNYLDKVPKRIAFITLPFMVYFVWIAGWKMFFILVIMVVVNVIYNYPPFRIKERPPFEILIQAGYVGTVLLSIYLNDLQMIPWQTFMYLTLFAFQAHIAGELMDIEPDLKAGKRTSATLIGRKMTKFLMFGILVVETYILCFWFKDYLLGSMLGIFAIWLLLDVWLVFKDRPYTLSQMKLFGLGMNASALATMLWVLYSGKLLTPVM